MENTLSSTTVSLESKFAKMRAFFVLWFGQLISTIGSSMTTFVLGVYVYQRTNSATDFALIFLVGMLPRTLFSPIAGVLADRFERRKLMVISDIGAMAGIGFALALGNNLQVWHIYLATFVGSTFSALRIPTYTTVAGMLVSKEQYGRVGGMIQLSDAVGQVVGPVVGGALMSVLAITNVLTIDIITFAVSLATLFMVAFPAITRNQEERGTFSEDIRSGWNYLVSRPGLIGLIAVFVIGNFFIGNAQALLTPMVLGFASPQSLGVIMSAGGVGMLIGGIVLSLWGGGKKKIYTILGFYILLGLGVLMAGLKPSVIAVGLAVFLAYLSLPFVIGTTNAILISKVAPAVQGRVFSLRIMLVTISFTVAFVAAGPLADQVFEPLLAPGGALVNSLGGLFGVGEGRGIGFMFTLLGIMAVLTAIGGLLSPRLRNVEAELPDAV